MCIDDFSSVAMFSFFLCWLKSDVTCVHFHEGEHKKELKKTIGETCYVMKIQHCRNYCV